MTAATATLTPADRAALVADDFKLTDAERAYVIEHLLDRARVTKTSVSKLSRKTIAEIVAAAQAEANDSDVLTNQSHEEDPSDGDDLAEVIELRPVAAEVKAPRVRGSHAGCTHDTGKVARAKCRRERARNA